MTTPRDLGLQQFAQWRPHQLEAIHRIASSDKRLVLLQAPTGSGKSLIGMATLRKLEQRGIYLCYTKQLQDQVVADFPEVREVKGRANYQCVREPGISADDCSHSRVGPCPEISKCPYRMAKEKALAAEVAALNVRYYLEERLHSGEFGSRTWLILDEVHMVEREMVSFLEFEITDGELCALAIPPPNGMYVARRTMVAIEAVRRRLQDLRDAGCWHSPERAKLEGLASRLALLKRAPDHWLCTRSHGAWAIRPIQASIYSPLFLLGENTKILGMSATILDRAEVASQLGVDQNDCEFIELPSTFAAERCPVIYDPAGDMSLKARERNLRALVDAVDTVLDAHPGDKGLIHTHSHELAEEITRGSRNTGRLMTHSTGDRAQVVDMFRKSPQAKVLVSPSMETGVDLPYDQCRFVVVAKVPYPDLGDPWVARRLENGNRRWYAWQTACSLMQMTGRGMRAADDECTSYILDSEFGRFYRRHRGLFPSWWREALQGL